MYQAIMKLLGLAPALTALPATKIRELAETLSFGEKFSITFTSGKTVDVYFVKLGENGLIYSTKPLLKSGHPASILHRVRPGCLRTMLLNRNYEHHVATVQK